MFSCRVILSLLNKMSLTGAVAPLRDAKTRRRRIITRTAALALRLYVHLNLLLRLVAVVVGDGARYVRSIAVHGVGAGGRARVVSAAGEDGSTSARSEAKGV